MNPTLYDILGVTSDAERDEIKHAWRDAADRFEPGSGGSSAQFRLFNEAAEVLLDPQRRRAYDEQLAVLGRTDPDSKPAVAPLAGPDPVRAGSVATMTRPTQTAEPLTPSDLTTTKKRSVPVAVLALLGVLAAAAVGLAIYLGADYQRATAYEAALDQAPSAAERAAVAVLSYDHESLAADRDAAAKFLTEDYRDDYVKTFNSLVQDNATETRAKVTAEVLASAAMLQSGEESGDKIPVLLFVNQTTVSTANSGEPTVALNRVRLDMEKVDGTWLVDGITSY
jgi:Mce-associated membrane protein